MLLYFTVEIAVIRFLIANITENGALNDGNATSLVTYGGKETISIAKGVFI